MPKGKRTRADGKRQRPQTHKVKFIKRPKGEFWYEMVAMFDGEAKQVMALDKGERVVMAGVIPPDMDVAICLVPPSVTNHQGLALQKILEAQFRKSVLVLSNNIQLVRLKAISQGRATMIMMEGKEDAEVIHIEKGARGPVAGEGEGVRAEDRPGHEGDLRPPGTAGPAENAGEDQAERSPPGSPETEPRPPE
jgi:hypothetical protein